MRMSGPRSKFFVVQFQSAMIPSANTPLVAKCVNMRETPNWPLGGILAFFPLSASFEASYVLAVMSDGPAWR